MGAGAIPVHIDKIFRDRKAGKHKLKVYTADFGYEGDDAINVSFHNGHYSLTPPKALILDYRLGRKKEKEFEKEYLEFLKESFIQYQFVWDNMLDSDKIVLVCKCNMDDKTCHRHFLIKFLKKFGATNKGKLKNK